jgi:hypothetical protein
MVGLNGSGREARVLVAWRRWVAVVGARVAAVASPAVAGWKDFSTAHGRSRFGIGGANQASSSSTASRREGEELAEVGNGNGVPGGGGHNLKELVHYGESQSGAHPTPRQAVTVASRSCSSRSSRGRKKIPDIPFFLICFL